MENDNDKITEMLFEAQERSERYEAKKKAKIERFKALAEKHKAKSSERAQLSSKMAAAIPMGQPIHVGHHSEKADRAYRGRIDSNMRKAVEHENAAEHFENRADKLENNTAIFSDDPEALNKLSDKVAALEALSLKMKQENAEWRKSKDPNKSKEVPHAHFTFTNLRGRIKTAQQRQVALSKAQDFKSFEVNDIKVELVDGQIRVHFPFKPDEETRKTLKSSPLVLKWSSYSGCWVRKYTGQGSYFISVLKVALGAAKA